MAYCREFLAWIEKSMGTRIFPIVKGFRRGRNLVVRFAAFLTGLLADFFIFPPS
jgi:hypothetical protein